MVENMAKALRPEEMRKAKVEFADRTAVCVSCPGDEAGQSAIQAVVGRCREAELFVSLESKLFMKSPS